MSLLSGLDNQNIDSIVSTTVDGYGVSTQTTEYTDVSCRWQDTTERITNNDNKEVITTAKIWLLPAYTDITYNYQIIRNSKTYTIQLIKNIIDLDGNLDHIKMFLI